MSRPSPATPTERWEPFRWPLEKKARGISNSFRCPWKSPAAMKFTGGMLPLGFDPPPGDYNVRLTAWRLPEASYDGRDRYLAQFWDA